MGRIKTSLSRCSIWGEYILIFVCVGSREYQFNRLLKKIDELIEQKIIVDDVFAQIGQSTYLPKYYRYKRFLSSEEFKGKQKEADLIISHAGTGALMSALKLEKKVIAVPRLEKFGEHTDDHQIQIASVLEESNYLKSVTNLDQLNKMISILDKKNSIRKYEKSSEVVNIIERYLQSVW